jgi:hypothetical protein
MIGKTKVKIIDDENDLFTGKTGYIDHYIYEPINPDLVIPINVYAIVVVDKNIRVYDLSDLEVSD